MEPLIQLSLDFVNLDEAIEAVEESIEEGIDLICINNSLLKSEGLKAVRDVKKRFPDMKLVVDTRFIESIQEIRAMADAGVDVIMFTDREHDNNSTRYINLSKIYGIEMMANLTNSSSIYERSRLLEELGVNYIFLQGNDNIHRLDEISNMLEIPVAFKLTDSDMTKNVLESGVGIVAVNDAKHIGKLRDMYAEFDTESAYREIDRIKNVLIELKRHRIKIDEEWKLIKEKRRKIEKDKAEIERLNREWEEVGSTSMGLLDWGILSIRDIETSKFDEAVLENTDLSHIDKNKLKEFLQRVAQHMDTKIPRLSPREVLEGFNCAVNTSLTTTGALFFAKNPQGFFPYIEIKAARFKGTKVGEFIDESRIRGTLPEMLDDAEKFVRKNTRKAMKVVEFERFEIPEYPYEAIRESIVNAIAHRDYSVTGATISVLIFDDRIEISSPGGLFGGLTIDNLEGKHITRNSMICKLLYEIGEMEEYGTGIRKMKKKMKDYGLPEPSFEEEAGFFKVTFYGPGDGILELTPSAMKEKWELK